MSAFHPFPLLNPLARPPSRFSLHVEIFATIDDAEIARRRYGVPSLSKCKRHSRCFKFEFTSAAARSRFLSILARGMERKSA
jgi:hypothetical protein